MLGPGQQQEGRSLLPERILWDCIEAISSLHELQIASMRSLTLGASHSYEARSMLYPVFQVLRPGYIVEIGTYHGLTSAFMWKLNKELGQLSKVITFDIAASKLAPLIWRSLGASGFVTFIHGDSADMIPKKCEEGIEFALIDGDHSYNAAERDWRAIQPLLAPRSVVFFDNMQHPGGCGKFFSTLQPLWFHPEMAIAVSGLTEREVHSLLTAYLQRNLPLWMSALITKRGDELRRNLRALLQMMQQPLSDLETQRATFSLCHDLSATAIDSERPRFWELMEISAHYGIGTLAEARHQQIREALPGWLHPWLSRVYRLVKSCNNQC